MRSASVAAHALGGVVLATVLTVPPTAAHAGTTHFVPCTGTNGGAAGLAAAVDDANNDGSGLIKLAPKCTYIFNTADDGFDALPLIEGNIVISGFESAITRDPNAPQFRIAAVGPTGSLTLIGITVSGGNTPNSGGGLTLSTGAEIFLKSSKVTGNRGNNGGGIFASGGSMVQLSKSLISDNHAAIAGGGILNGGGAVRAFGSTFARNTSNFNGGAILNFGVAKLTRSSVIGNKAAFGGGISNLGESILQVNRSTIADNRSTNNGGGIENSSQAKITDSLITKNIADVSALGTGGGIFNDGSVNLLRGAVIRNYPNNCAGSVQVPGCMN